MKKCSLCRTNKEVGDFNKNRTKRDGLSDVCRECNRQKSKQYYADNREKHKAVCSAKKKKYITTSRLEIDAIKKMCGCQMGCGETEPCCLDFHHFKDKDYLISKMPWDGFSWKSIQKEIKKCAVVCSNCHRKIHAGLLGGPTMSCMGKNFVIDRTNKKEQTKEQHEHPREVARENKHG